MERVEHTGRLLAVNLNMTIDEAPGPQAERWRHLLRLLHIREPEGQPLDGYTMLQAIAFDRRNPNSIVSCLASARENARIVREQISSEMWEHINSLYLSIQPMTAYQVWDDDPFEFLAKIRYGTHLFEGISDSTMNHGEGWHFIQAGRFIERSVSLSALLAANHSLLEPDDTDFDLYPEWVGLLKSCTAFEAHCKIYSADLKPQSIAEFLLLDVDFPHAVAFAITRLQYALDSISEATGKRRSSANRLIGRLRALLGYTDIHEIMSGSLDATLADIQRRCADIHEAIHRTYFAYPIESVLSD